MKGNPPTLDGLRRIRIATICAFLATLIVVHHADAQSIDSAVSPAASADTAELENRSLKLDFSAAPAVLRIVLPAADAASKRSEAEARDRRPLQIGFPRAIPSDYRGDLSPLIDWTSFDDGSIGGAVLVTSPGAQALRVAIRAELGSGGEIRFFEGNAAEENTEQVPASQDFPVVTREDFYEDGEPEILWSPTVEGDTFGIEITLPSREALSDFSLSIEQLSHIYVPMESLGDVPKQLDCRNHIDVQCRVGSISRNIEAAVARINFVKSGHSYVCSGTLLNVTADTGFIPYFLTANHCVSTGTVARTVEARWFYQRASCGSTRIDSRDRTTSGGADLLATSVAQDSTLLRFKGSLPGGLIYSGWSAASISHPTQVYGIHHPDGDVKKYSAGRTIRQADRRLCEDPENEIGCFTVKSAIVVDWSEGATEGGSSGSGLFRGQHLIGVLSGGSGLCGSGSDDDTYGPFQDFFPETRRWLRPESPPPASAHALPLVTPASNTAQQGFVRIVNRSASAGTVRIHAIDDTGRRFGPVSLRLLAKQTRHFTSVQLERGGAGLSGGVGDGTGNWRLELETSLDIEPLAYIRSAGGVVTGVHAVAEETVQGSGRIYHVPFFFPGSNQRQVSSLRLVNPGNANASIVVTGVDDRGRAAPQGEVRLALRAGAARMVTAQQLESGSGLSGRLGDGTGYWQLSISANRPIQVMSLLRSPTGHLINLSRGRAEFSGGPPSPTGPDLVVQLPSVSNSSPNPGQSFTLRATVRNQGNARSAATRLRYFRSSNATISTTDTQVGTDAVSGLAASGTSPESISLRAPSSAGTYYYGACVASVSGESNTGNNCSSGVRVTVGSVRSAPDLVVQSPSVSNSSPNPGQSFTLRATVRNQGNARSAATRLRYFRSSNATISTTDTQVGTDAVSGLAASGTSPESISLRAPSSAGTYYYGACVASVSGESNTGNNCSSGVRVTVSGPGGSNYVGAIATGWVGQTCGFGWGLAINYRTKAAAIARAESECRSLGLRACEWVVTFPKCGALAYGESSTVCSVFGGYGSSRSAAEQDALSFCGASFSGCTVPREASTGRNASYCNAGAGSASAAEMQSDRMQSDRQMADSPLDSRGSGPTSRHRSAHPVDGRTDRIEP